MTMAQIAVGHPNVSKSGGETWDASEGASFCTSPQALFVEATRVPQEPEDLQRLNSQSESEFGQTSLFDTATAEPTVAGQTNSQGFRGTTANSVPVPLMNPETQAALGSAELESTVTTSIAPSLPAQCKRQKRDNETKKLQRPKKQKQESGAGQLELREVKTRKLKELSPTSIGIARPLLELLTRRFIGLFKLEFPILTEKGARRLGDMLRIHVIEQRNGYVCVGGYIALQVILSLKNPPKTIFVDLHTRFKEEDMEEWAVTEFQIIPLIFQLQKEEELSAEATPSDGQQDSLFAGAKPRRKRTRRDDESFKLRLETWESPVGKQLMNKPANDKDMATLLRVSERTISNRRRNTR